MEEYQGSSFSFIDIMDSLAIHIHPFTLEREYFMAEKGGALRQVTLRSRGMLGMILNHMV